VIAAFVRKEDIVCLEVAVDDPEAVEEVKGLEQLLHYCPDALKQREQWDSLGQSFEKAPREQRHYKAHVIVSLK
jgi:hypothetical protein